MTNVERERHGSDHMELPKPKRLSQVESFGERFRVREGYGDKGDVTVIGRLPGEAKGGLKGAVGWDGPRRYYVASTLAHPVAADALSTYMLEADCKPGKGRFRAVRFNTDPLIDDAIILDAASSDADIACAKAILSDIGHAGSIGLGVV